MCLVKRLIHLVEFLVKLACAGHFREHFEEPSLAAHHHLLHLSLLDNLELALSVERESTRLKQVEQILLLNVLPVQVVVFAVRARIVRLAHHEGGRFERNPPVAIVEGHLHRVSVVVTARCVFAAGPLATLLYKVTLVRLLTWRKLRFSYLLFYFQLSLSANTIATLVFFIKRLTLQEVRFSTAVFAKDEVAARTELLIVHLETLITRKSFNDN